MGEKATCGTGCCDQQAAGYETITIEKTNRSCSMCEDFAKRNAAKAVAVISCEGACLRGEISRQAANILCHKLAPEKTVRVCHGAASTKDTGQRALVKNAQKVLILDGCHVECAARMIRGVLPGIDAEGILTDRLCTFDTSLYGIDEMPDAEIKALGEEVARKIAATL